MGSGRHGMVPSVQTWGAPGALLRALDCPHFKFLMMKYHQMASPTTRVRPHSRVYPDEATPPSLGGLCGP